MSHDAKPLSTRQAIISTCAGQREPYGVRPKHYEAITAPHTPNRRPWPAERCPYRHIKPQSASVARNACHHRSRKASIDFALTKRVHHRRPRPNVAKVLPARDATTVARRLSLSRPTTRPSLAPGSRCRALIGVRNYYRRARSVTLSRYRRVSPLSAHMRDTQATNGSSESNNAAVPGLCVTTQATIGVRSLIGTRVK